MRKINKSKLLFNFISPIYGLFYNSQKKHYLDIINNMNDKLKLSGFNNIVDIGCGTGALCSSLNKFGLSVTGVDPAPRMLKIGAKKPENKGISFINGSTASRLPFDNKSFDISIASYVAHGLKVNERIEMYKEMSRISKYYVIFHDYNDVRSIPSDIIEFLEGGNYFKFIKEVRNELKDNFESFEVINIKKHASWYICKPK